ncbi:MAG: hypothetical protein LBH26_06160 [Treponema sp.]|jgi:hypothetical protein|nr:hypothetical protein [Treponema sp.]
MAGKRVFLALFLPFLLALPLEGQETPGGAGGEDPSYIERAGEGERFIQRLVWERDAHTYRYEITVEERNSSGEYAEILREFRTENSIEFSLPPGLYRYRIRVFNLLNRPAGVSAWMPFSVIPALQPELHSLTQEYFPPDQAYPQGALEIILYGRNLVEGMALDILPLDTEGDPIRPDYFPRGESIRLIFEENLPAPGRYRVYVRNPGGLENSLEITVTPPSSVTAAPDTPAADTGDAPAVDAGDSGAPRGSFTLGFSISAAYTPLIPLYGYLFTPFDRGFFPVGASLKADLVPLSRPWGDLGLELAGSWNMLTIGAVEVHLGGLHLNGIYQRRIFGQRAALVVRLGAGTDLLSGTNPDKATSIFNWILAVCGGASLRWFLPAPGNSRGTAAGTFYVEAGMEYTHLFATDSPTAYIKPGLGAGWKF